MSSEEFKTKFTKGEDIEDDVELTEEIIGKLGIHHSLATNVFNRLWENGKTTWGNLLDLKSEEKAIEAAGWDEGNGAILWKAIQDYKNRREQYDERLKFAWRKQHVEDSIDVVKRLLDQVPLHVDSSHYELPYFTPTNSRAATEVPHEKRVRAQINGRQLQKHPDLLMSHLERPVVSLCEMGFHEQERHFSLTVDNQRHAPVHKPKLGPSFYVAIIGTSGAGKTRFLFEQAYSQFACLLSPLNQNGSGDLATILNSLGGEKLSAEVVETARKRLQRETLNILGIRALVLKYLMEKVKGFEPRHWLAVQVAPEYFLGSDVFKVILEQVGDREFLDPQSIYHKSGMRFVAIDNAQVFEVFWPGTFLGRQSLRGRSALGPIVDALVSLGTGVVLSGRGLNVITSIDLLGGAAVLKPDGQFNTRIIYGVVNPLTVADLRRIFMERVGYDSRHLSDEALTTFQGRPRFGMRLLEELLLGKSVETIKGEFLKQLAPSLEKASIVKLDVRGSTKTLLGELNKVATRKILKGQDGITVGGERALEKGLCDIQDHRKRLRIGGSSGSACTYTIEEPLIIEAMERRGLPILEDVTNEDPILLGTLFEEYVALNAHELVAIVNNVETDGFAGPWTLPQPGADRIRGKKVENGDEVAALRDMIQEVHKGTNGIYIVFPGEDFGADIIICSRRADGCVLLKFVQCEARFKTSTPEALLTLQFPYHTNRGKPNQSLPAKYKQHLADLETILRLDEVKVAFVVFKYPARSKANVAPISVVSCSGWHQSHKGPFPVLQIILDGKSVPEFLSQRAVSNLQRLHTVGSSLT